jgi:serine/threonine protein kinase
MLLPGPARSKSLNLTIIWAQIWDEGIDLVIICKSKATGEEQAYKILPKKTKENVYREVKIIKHLSSHLIVDTLSAVYEDADSLHLVMELWSRVCPIDNMSRNDATQHQAAKLIIDLILVIKYFHEMGVDLRIFSEPVLGS